MTLVELLVAMLIGLGVTLAITTLLISGESHKRITTSTNDAEQTGAYVTHALDGALRGAGSAIAQSNNSVSGLLGCKLNAAGLFPRAGAFPPPFSTGFLSGATANLRVAPLLIAKGQSDVNANGARSDVLMVMGGSGSAGGVSRQITNGGNSTSVTLDSSVGFVNNDLLLVSQNGVVDCLLEQVSPAPVATNPTLNLASTATYYTQNGTTTNLQTLAGSTSSYVTPIGNAAANNLQFELFGVGANRVLYSYDLLQNTRLVQGSGGDVSQPIADGVDQMYAIYGIDTNADGKQETWADPGVAPYDIASVMANPATMLTIVSVRVALVLRGEYYDKNNDNKGQPVTPPTLTLFSGLSDSTGAPVAGLQKTINLNAVDQHYRYRVFEFTVPLRNMILLAGGP